MSKALFAALEEQDLTEYGAFIPESLVHDIVGIHYPEQASLHVFERIRLRELQATNYVRAQLLKEGKYLKECNGGYRILTPDENAAQVRLINAQAQRRLRVAVKLWKNTPKQATTEHNNLAARMLLKGAT